MLWSGACICDQAKTLRTTRNMAACSPWSEEFQEKAQLIVKHKNRYGVYCYPCIQYWGPCKHFGSQAKTFSRGTTDITAPRTRYRDLFALDVKGNYLLCSIRKVERCSWRATKLMQEPLDMRFRFPRYIQSAWYTMSKHTAFLYKRDTVLDHYQDKNCWIIITVTVLRGFTNRRNLTDYFPYDYSNDLNEPCISCGSVLRILSAQFQWVICKRKELKMFNAANIDPLPRCIARRASDSLCHPKEGNNNK